MRPCRSCVKICWLVTPKWDKRLDELAGKISDDDMRQLNYAVDGQHRDVKEVVERISAQEKSVDRRFPASVLVVELPSKACRAQYRELYINHTASTSTITCERGIFCWAAYASIVLSNVFSFSRLADFTTK